MNPFVTEKNCSCRAVTDTSLGVDRILRFRVPLPILHSHGKWCNFLGLSSLICKVGTPRLASLGGEDKMR